MQLPFLTLFESEDHALYLFSNQQLTPAQKGLSKTHGSGPPLIGLANNLYRCLSNMYEENKFKLDNMHLPREAIL